MTNTKSQLQARMIAIRLVNAQHFNYVERLLCSDGVEHTGWITGKVEWHHSQRDFYGATLDIVDREVRKCERNS